MGSLDAVLNLPDCVRIF